MKHLSMRARLLLSFAMVTLAGAAAFFIAARWLVPTLFDEHMGNMNGAGMGNMNGAGNGNGSGGSGGGGVGDGTITATGVSAAQHDAIVSAVNTSMFIALAASLVLSTLIALVMSRRTLLSLDQLRVGARGLAAGNYDERVARPAEPELADLADDINHLAASLAQTEQRRAALIGDVAHEMRTPLTTMNGVLEGFDDGLFTAAELADAVRTEVARLHHLAGDLAAVSRAEEGRLQLDRQAGDLREVITSVAERLRTRFDTAGIGLTVEAPTALPATFDHERMVQVLTNLIGNALAYTPGGGTVTVNAHATAGEVRIAVTDTGRGLLPQDLERIFERFYRADPHDHSGGTGIGLTISRAIARAHGGRLTATSPGPGRGATFELVVPTD